MASQVGSQTDADYQGHPVISGYFGKVADSQNDVVFLIGMSVFSDTEKFPQILLGRF